MRTYLLSHVRSVAVLSDEFELPDDLASRLREQRATETVQVSMLHSTRWAADMYAEHVTVVADEENSVTLKLAMLPPLERRLGLLLLVAGPEASVVSPPHLAAAGADLARELLQHHGG